MAITILGTPQFPFEQSSVTGTITVTEASIGTIGSTDLVCALWYSTDVQLTPPSNLPLKFSWTDVNGGRWGYYERVGSGGTQYVFTEQFTHAHSIAIWALSGADTSTGLLPNTPTTNSYSTGADSTFVAPSVTTTASNSMRFAVYEFINHNSVATPPSGMTALGISATTAGVGDCLAIFYAIQASPGVSGTASAGLGGGDLGAAFQMYVAPAITGPTITSQPTNQFVQTGNTATFSVSATASAGTLSYQWQSSPDNTTWTNISGATSSSYTTGTLTTSNSGTYYRCIVTDSNGSTASSSAILIVSVAGAGLLQIGQAVPAQTWGWIASNSNVFILSAGGTVSFSGAGAVNKTRVFAPSGALTFSGNSSYLRSKIFSTSGLITFSGNAAYLRVHTYNNGGVLTYSGTSPLTFQASSGTTYILSPGGTYVLSGIALYSHTKSISSSGTLTYSGNTLYNRNKQFTPSGTITFSGSSVEIKTKIVTPSGVLTFYGNSPIIYAGSGAVSTTSMKLTFAGIT